MTCRDDPGGGVGGQQAVLQRTARDDHGPARHWDGPGTEVGHRSPAAGAAEVQHLPVAARHPLQVLGGLQLAAPAERLPVENQGRGRIVLLRLDAERAEPGRLRQVSGIGPEPERRALSRPGQRDPASVAALFRTAGPQEGGILDTLGRNVRDLVQAEFLSLVQVDRPGQRQHQQGGRAGAAQAEAAIELG
jgi:hypothetical protein